MNHSTLDLLDHLIHCTHSLYEAACALKNALEIVQSDVVIAATPPSTVGEEAVVASASALETLQAQPVHPLPQEARPGHCPGCKEEVLLVEGAQNTPPLINADGTDHALTCSRPHLWRHFAR